jgi:hypothetical protein
MFSFLGYEIWQMTIKFLSVHTSMKHHNASQQEMFLQLSAVQFLALLLQEECRIFCKLKLCLSHDILWGSLELAYKSPSNVTSCF